ncbi:MAG: DUF86 domain-containing protein [Bacteroidales bacterium]|nr:DUF86 domain-containing protein [Bacteroidales bacterium]
MREPMRDPSRLEHIMSAIEKIEEYTKDITYEQFVADSMRMHATTYNIQIIGEAVYKLSKEFKEKHSDITWVLAEKMRHILVHDYYQVSAKVVWNVVEEDVPVLKKAVRAIVGKMSEK